ncbi:MAG: hypothetical protein K8L97_33070 [Anaerolineae bacterium]|nr:hypothetical protein [Anaerolineae bacterium]
MTYARARRYLGIASVGFWVILSAVALLTNLPTTLFPLPELDPSASAQRVLILIGAYILLSLPFDLLGGYVLPHRFSRPAPAFPAYIIGWLRGVLVQGIIMFAVGMLLITAGKQSGSLFLVAVIAGIVMLGLLALQIWIAWLSGGFKVIKPDLSAYAKVLKRWNLELPEDIAVFKGNDIGFVGALVGLPGLEKLVLPAHWLEKLNEEQLAAQIVRRIGAVQRGGRERGVYLALAWNLIGFYIAGSLAGTEAVTNARGLFTTVLYFNLWSFLGLLVLPSFSRPGVYQVDRFAKKAGIPHDVLDQVVIDLDKLQDDEPARSRLVETIFHPIPSVENRLEHLAHKGTGGWGSWHGARMALFLSWACLGCLSRAVHCNVGRPELWAMLPGD